VSLLVGQTVGDLLCKQNTFFLPLGVPSAFILKDYLLTSHSPSFNKGGKINELQTYTSLFGKNVLKD
jgi:hypothetical protein